MSFESKSQQGYLESHPEILGSKIKEWEQSTDYSKLPKRKKKATSRPRGKFGTIKKGK